MTTAAPLVKASKHSGSCGPVTAAEPTVMHRSDIWRRRCTGSAAIAGRKALTLRLRSLAVIAAAVGFATAGTGATAAHANNFSQNWSSSASYRASIDFIPSASTITLYGSACASKSGANQFDIEL